jgi:apolipoprotein N-acyltransferase
VSGRARLLFGLAYAGATFLAFPHPVAGTVIDLGALAAWLAPACLLLAVRGASPRRAAWVGLGAGVAAHGAVLHWIYVVTVTYGHAAPLVGVIAPLLLGLYVAAFTAAFAAGAAGLARAGLAGPFALAALWTALDYLRSFALTGFPWATLGYAQHQNRPLLGLAALTGVYGLSFATVLGSASTLAWLEARRARRGAPRAALVGLAAVAALHALGAARAASTDPEPAGPRVRIAVLQGNIDQGVKWSPAWAERTLRIYEELTRESRAEGAELIVWPETAVPGSPDVDPELRGRLSALARETGAALVVGAVGVEGHEAAWAGGEEEPRLFDSAFLFEPSGRLVTRYDKTHLVPFGEYLPLRALLGRFIRAIATGSAGRDVSAGEAPRAVTFAVGARASPAAAPAPGAMTAGVPICYELLFPDLVRRFVAEGAGVLLAITNDAWYGRTGAPYQFLVITALRSAETGVWTARAANTGVSAFIDARGRVRSQTPIFERGFLVEDVPVREAGRGDTFYVRHGDVFAKGCGIGILGVAALALVRSRRPEGEGERQ